MPGRTQMTLLAALCAATVAGCGSGDDGTIPPQDAEEMIAFLDGVESNAQAGSCDLAQNQAEDFKDVVSALPSEVDPEVEQGLTEAAANLVTLAQSQCTDQGTSDTGFEPTTSTTTSVPATTSSTTSTETSTTTDEDETAPPTGGDEGNVTIEPPSDEGGGTGGGPPSGGIGGERSVGGQ